MAPVGSGAAAAGSAKQQKNTYTAAEVAVLENTIQEQQAQIEELKRKLEHMNEVFAPAPLMKHSLASPSSVRSKVEHAFRIMKCQFGYRKTAYRGLQKNENRLYAMFACANLYSLAIAGRNLSTT